MNIAILGCGYIAYYYSMALVNHSSEINVIGYFDTNPERCKKTAEHFNKYAYRSFAELLNDNQIDLVVNLTVPGEHFWTNMEIINAGKNVYCEKPLAGTLEEAEILKETSERLGVILSGAPCSHMAESVAKVAELLAEDAIGKVRFAELNMHDFRVDSNRPDLWFNPLNVPWNYHNEFEVGCTAEHCSYSLSIATTLFGPIREVASSAHIVVPEKKINDDETVHCTTPDYTNAVLTFDHGVYARLECGIVTNKPDRSVVIHGDKGTIKIVDCWDYLSPIQVMQLERDAYGRGSKEYEITFDRNNSFIHDYGLNMDQGRGLTHILNNITNFQDVISSTAQIIHITELTQLISEGKTCTPTTAFRHIELWKAITQIRATWLSRAKHHWSVVPESNQPLVKHQLASIPSTILSEANLVNNKLITSRIEDNDQSLLLWLSDPTQTAYLPLNMIELLSSPSLWEHCTNRLYLGDGFMYDSATKSQLREKYPNGKLKSLSANVTVNTTNWNNITCEGKIIALQQLLLRMFYIREHQAVQAVTLVECAESSLTIELHWQKGSVDIITITMDDSPQTTPFRLQANFVDFDKVSIDLSSGSALDFTFESGITSVINHINWANMGHCKVNRVWDQDILSTFLSTLLAVRESILQARPEL
ncbi:Gfo/Idh/MocA family protein [Photobacterium minamisatsumaniensis]|uniref:Gfo/Idh/MocA family protein n=1 Tax=Photobacterium minamisatsumaniensis TaxID=2910233 RepID=UPI003D0BE9AE